MEAFDIFKVAEKPKLRFGEPLSEVCDYGVFHQGLKVNEPERLVVTNEDLFLKAYLSARGDDGSDSGSQLDKPSRVLLALKSGSEGQGSLYQRMNLKAKLEAGHWILPAQTPAGSPLWLLRHFLGRLPQPLLQGSHWKTLAEACGPPEPSWPDQVFERISRSAKALSHTELEVLALLTLLIRKLSLLDECSREREDELDHDVLIALSQYFIPSITSRPYRPGLFTRHDRKFQPLLVFFAQNWHAVFQRTCDSPTPNSISDSHKESPKSVSSELRSYFESDSLSSDNADDKCRNKFIGFEALLNGESANESAENLRRHIKSKCARRNLFNNLNDDKINLTLNQSCKKKALESDVLDDVEGDNNSEENTLVHSEVTENNDVSKCITIKENVLQDKPGCHSALVHVKTNSLSDVLSKSKSDTRVEPKLRLCKRAFLFNSLPANLVNQCVKNDNIVKSSSTESEFFSLPNSDNSD